MLAVQPTVELAKRFSRQRIEPLIAESPALRERVKPSRARDAGNTVLSKEFPAGLLIITGANSAVGLRSMPARYLFLDEVDAYPPSADEEGDPVALAEARTRTFSWRSKVLLGSTPTIHGISRIEREYEASDQRRYFVPCPHCEHMQWLEFERLRWDKGKPETAHYECATCDGRIEEHHKTAMLAGRRVASHRGRRRSRHHRLPSLGALFAGRLVLLGRHRPDVGGGAGHRRGQAQLQEQRAGRDLGRDRRGAGLAAALRAPRGLADRHRAEWRTVPDRRRRRAEGPHRGRRLGLGPRARKLARRSHRHRRRARASRELGRAPASYSARPGRMRTARSLAWPSSRSTPATSRPRSTPGRADAGHAQVAPIKGVEGFNRAAPVDRPDACRRHRRRQEAAPRRAAVDDRGRDLQERDLSLPAPVGADRRGNRRGCEMPGGLRASAATAPRPSG